MRRKRRSDSFDEDDFRAKRDRTEPDTIESLIYRIGFKDLSNIERDIGELASVILTDIPKNGEGLLKVLSNCVKNVPERILIYATLVGLLNLKNRSFVGQLIELLQRDLKDAIRSANFEDAKYIVLFLSVSVNCHTVQKASILGLYENFAEVTLDAGRSSQARTDWYTYVILYGLPYSGYLLASYDASALNDILGTIEVYMTLKEHGQPHKLSPLTPPDYDAEVIYPLPSVIFRMFDYTDVIDQDENEIVPNSDLSSDGVKSSKETPVLPGAHTIERFLIDEHLAILMNNLSFNRVMCAKALLGLKTRAKVALDYMIIEAVFAGMFHLPRPPVQHGNLLFYGSLLVQLCHEASNTIPLVLAQATEVLFERLDNMKPVCIGSFSYYENVKRLLPKSFYIMLPPQPTVINKYESNPDLSSARAFFRLVDSIRARLEPQTVLRIAETASQSRGRRLSLSEPFDNDGVRDERDEDASSDDSHSDHSDEERRGKSPIDTIPLSDPEFDELDDPEPAKQEMRSRLKARRRILRESAMKRNLKISSEDNADEQVGVRSDSVEKLPFTTAPQVSELSPGVTNLAIELFYSAMLIAGHKTISHTFAFIKKYAAVIRTLTSTVETQVEALHVIQAVWANNPQMIVIITEHMCRVGLIDPEAVVRWAYSPIMTTLTDDTVNLNSANARPKILDFYVWECLSRTLVRVGRRVTRITNRLELAKETMEINRRSSPYSTPDREDADQGGDGDSFSRTGVDSDSFFKKPKDSISGRVKVSDRRKLMAGCELVSSSDDEAYGGGKDNVGGRVARLEEARCEAVRSQCAVITLLLHRHARLTAELASEMSGPSQNHSFNTDSPFFLHEPTQPKSLSDEALRNIMFWLKGRLVQVVLEHCDQLIPYLDNLDEFICGAHPEVQGVFQQLRSLYA
ncbi:putative nuclear cap-binding protein [Schistosoma mansoni]|uniref:putative nuclear cap-binding protein n=1 Tax=Schistosoma mansoni TaxID=6183 RepID=UPI0001A644C0|nr:putative nuclear cap-binding protein [Schistosoma mansoni]|eukprot:XP_018653933.1 putative nuclear cap-binding protein [Schistosoma mansoni]